MSFPHIVLRVDSGGTTVQTEWTSAVNKTCVKLRRSTPADSTRRLEGAADAAMFTLRCVVAGAAFGIAKGILNRRGIITSSKRAQLHFEKGPPAIVVREPHSGAIEYGDVLFDNFPAIAGKSAPLVPLQHPARCRRATRRNPCA